MINSRNLPNQSRRLRSIVSLGAWALPIAGVSISSAVAVLLVANGARVAPAIVAFVILFAVNRDLLLSALLTLVLFDGTLLAFGPVPVGLEEQVLKTIILGIVLLLLVTKGTDRKGQIISLAIVLASAVPWMGAPFSGAPSVSVSRQLIGLGMLAIPWLIVGIRMAERSASLLLASLVALPIVATIAGLVNWLANDQLPWRYDFGMFFRLQGTLAPALLGLVAACGVLASAVLILQRRAPIWVIILPLFVALLSGSRGSVIFSVLITIGMVVSGTRRRFRYLGVALGFLLLVVSVLAVLEFTLRADGSMGAAGLTGRVEAWSEFTNVASRRSLFGYGAGATAGIDTTSGVHESFVLPHNEFIHFWLDFGAVGSLVVWLAIGAVLLRFARFLCLEAWKVALLILSVCTYAFVDNTFTSLQFLVPFALILAATFSIGKDPDQVAGVY